MLNGMVKKKKCFSFLLVLALLLSLGTPTVFAEETGAAAGSGSGGIFVNSNVPSGSALFIKTTEEKITNKPKKIQLNLKNKILTGYAITDNEKTGLIPFVKMWDVTENKEVILSEDALNFEQETILVELSQLDGLKIGNRYKISLEKGLKYYEGSDVDTPTGELSNQEDCLIFQGKENLKVEGYTIGADNYKVDEIATGVSIYPTFQVRFTDSVNFARPDLWVKHTKIVPTSGTGQEVGVRITQIDDKTLKITSRDFLDEGKEYKVMKKGKDAWTSSDDAANGSSGVSDGTEIFKFQIENQSSMVGLSEANPYKINSAKELYDIRTLPNWSNLCYKLEADIDLKDLWEGEAFDALSGTAIKHPDTGILIGGLEKGTKNWDAPREKQTQNPNGAFCGIFDGNGHTISNMICKDNGLENMGLFGSVQGKAGKGVIKNVTVAGVQIGTDEGEANKRNKGYGGIAGWISNNAKIENCHVIGTADCPSIIMGVGELGGIVGGEANDASAIDRCSVENVQIKEVLAGKAGYNIDSYQYFGGILGRSKSDVKITDCQVKDVIITGSANVGGIAGEVRNLENCTVENVTLIAGGYLNKSSFSPEGGQSAGGLVGLVKNAGTLGIRDSVAKNVNIYGLKELGGAIGTLQIGTIENCHVQGVTLQPIGAKVGKNGAIDMSVPMVGSTALGGFVGNATDIPKWSWGILNSSAKNVKIKGLNEVGGFVGTMKSTKTPSPSSITGCMVGNVTISLPGMNAGENPLIQNMGGFAGVISGGALSNARVDGTSVSGKDTVGGFVGSVSEKTEIKDAYTSAWVLGTTVGAFSASHVGTYSNCVYHPNVLINIGQGTASIPQITGISKEVISSGSGSNSSSSIPKVPTINTDGQTITVSTAAEGKMDGSGKAVAGVTGNQIAEALKKVTQEIKEKNKNAVVEIQVSADKKASEIETTIPKTSLKDVANSDAQGLTISTPLAQITLDKEALRTVEQEADGKNVSISVKLVDKTKLSIAEKLISLTRPIYDLSILSDGKLISNFKGGKATIALPYTLAPGEKADQVTIFYIDDNGNLTLIKNCKYDEKTKSVTFTTDHFSYYAIGYEENRAKKFVDVSEDDWYATYVSYLVNKGILNGKTETAFMPKDSITRAEFAMILAKAAKADLTKQSQPTFTDVAHQAWYAQAVAWAADNGVVAGVGNQKFAPSAKITRQDMAVMLHRYTEKIMKKPITGTNKAMAFSDSHLIADYAKDSVSKMQQANIISGRGNHVFAPKENASRAEAAKMVTVLLKEAEK